MRRKSVLRNAAVAIVKPADAGYRDHTAGIPCFDRPARMRPDHDNIGDDSDWGLMHSMK